MNPDIILFHWLNDWVGRFPIVDWLARMIVNDYFVFALAALLLGGLWFSGDTPEERRRNQQAVLFALLGMLFTNALIKDLQLVFFRPRPFATEPVNLLFYRPSVSSFPSVPVATLSAWATAVRLSNRTVGNWLIILTILFALSRWYAGVHYPSDLVGGAVIGVFCAYAPIRIGGVFHKLAAGAIRIAERISLV